MQLGDLEFLSTFKKVVNAKLDVFELKVDYPLFNPEDLDNDFFLKFQDELSTTNLLLTIHGPYIGIDLAHPSEFISTAAMNRIVSSIEFASLLNVEYILIHGGGINRDYLPWNKFVEKAEQRYQKNLEIILNKAEGMEVEVVLENTESSFNFPFVDTIEKLENYLNLFPTVKGVIDFGHLNITSDVQDTIKYLEKENFYDRIKGFHIHNNDGKFDCHRSTNNGTIDYNYINSELLSKLSRKILICEMDTVEEAVEFKEIIEGE